MYLMSRCNDKAAVTKVVGIGERTKRSMEQDREHRDRPKKYSQLIFDEVAKMVFPTNGTEAAGHTHAKNESSCRLRSFIKVNSNWVTDLNVNIKL